MEPETFVGIIEWEKKYKDIPRDYIEGDIAYCLMKQGDKIYYKAFKSIFPSSRMGVIHALLPALEGTPYWDQRWDVEWYVNRCIVAGFCKTDDQIRLCAQRYVVGKRKVTPPGTRRRKEEARRMRKMLANTPVELMAIIDEAIKMEAAKQYLAGNDKSLNSVLGFVLRQYKTDANVVRALLMGKLPRE
jgi:hypothetical protein